MAHACRGQVQGNGAADAAAARAGPGTERKRHPDGRRRAQWLRRRSGAGRSVADLFQRPVEEAPEQKQEQAGKDDIEDQARHLVIHGAHVGYQHQ